MSLCYYPLEINLHLIALKLFVSVVIIIVIFINIVIVITTLSSYWPSRSVSWCLCHYSLKVNLYYNAVSDVYFVIVLLLSHIMCKCSLYNIVVIIILFIINISSLLSDWSSLSDSNCLYYC